jgi:hypothetical protein
MDLSKCWNCSCRGHTSWLHIGFTLRFSLRVYLTGLLYGFYTRFLYSGNLFGTIVLIFCLYIWGQLPFKLIIKQLKQFNQFYAAHISLLLLCFSLGIICHFKSQAEVHPVGMFCRYIDFALRFMLAMIIATFSWILS